VSALVYRQDVGFVKSEEAGFDFPPRGNTWHICLLNGDSAR